LKNLKKQRAIFSRERGKGEIIIMKKIFGGLKSV